MPGAERSHRATASAIAQQHPHSAVNTGVASIFVISAGKEEELAKGCTHGIWQEDWGIWRAWPQVNITPGLRCTAHTLVVNQPLYCNHRDSP